MRPVASASGDWGDSPVSATKNAGGSALDIGDGDGCGLVLLGLLAGGRVRHVRRMDERDWEGIVIRSTWKPFLCG